MTGTIRVRTVEDTEAEGSETFRVTLTSVTTTGVELGHAMATGTITDDDTLTASVTGPGVVKEGTTALFQVRLTGGTGSEDVVVKFAVSGTAEIADYAAPTVATPGPAIAVDTDTCVAPATTCSGTLTFDFDPATETTGTIPDSGDE